MFSTYSTEVNEGMILQGGVPGGNRWHVWVYLGLQVQHGLLKGLGWRPLVVTEYSDGTIGPVVRQDLGWDALIRCAQREEGATFVYYLPTENHMRTPAEIGRAHV